MTSSPRGATLGKQALGLRIVRADGAQLSFGRATARHFLKVMITPLVPFAIGYLMAAFTARKRALHDFLADTLVIRSHLTISTGRPPWPASRTQVPLPRRHPSGMRDRSVLTMSPMAASGSASWPTSSMASC